MRSGFEFEVLSRFLLEFFGCDEVLRAAPFVGETPGSTGGFFAATARTLPASCDPAVASSLACTAPRSGFAALRISRAQQTGMAKVRIQMDHQLRRIIHKRRRVILYSLNVQHYAHNARVVLRHPHSGQKIPADLHVAARHFRRQPRGMQIEKDAFRIFDPRRCVLHRVFEVDGHARLVGVRARRDSPDARSARGSASPVASAPP